LYILFTSFHPRHFLSISDHFDVTTKLANTFATIASTLANVTLTLPIASPAQHIVPSHQSENGASVLIFF
jgi:hypothetical protein